MLLAVAFRRVGGLRLRIWQIFVAGAAVVVAAGTIPLRAALDAVDWNVLGFLFGVFVLGEGLARSGVLESVSLRVLGRGGSVDRLVLAVLFGSGCASALLMNDTLAVVGTPLVLGIARRQNLPPVLLLLALAFGITIGSVTSPIGNPQNLLIALQGGLAEPFRAFFAALAPPTLACLLVAWVLLRARFADAFRQVLVPVPGEPIRDPVLARLAIAGAFAMVALIVLRVLGPAWIDGWPIPLWAVAAVGCAPLLAGSRERMLLVRRVDWPTLAFFAALFVLMRAVWDTGAVQSWLPADAAWQQDPAMLIGGGILLSQLLSNVPLVALLLPLISGASEPALLALAAGSTLAGNLTLVGAASNVIIAQAAERDGEHLGFWQFLVIGAPLTLLCALVYWAFLA
ncbi:MAG: SLC13 family permease [Pseudomonadales bacterium]